MKVPFVDLKAQYKTIKNEIDNAIKLCIESTSFVGGDAISKFESEFAQYIGVHYCITCANGTDALEIALSALGITNGDEVLVPALTWISTAEAVRYVGAEPVFVDIDPDTYNIDVNRIEEKITNNTKAIIPVHFYGQPAIMDKITDLAKEYNLRVVEDCAQSHGAKFNDTNVGTFGDISTFSFYPGKNLGCYGDGGCLVTNNNNLANKIRLLANHGQAKKNDHLILGRNSRLDTIQASILSAKLPHLNQWIKNRQSISKEYSNLLDDDKIKKPYFKPIVSHVFHLYVIQVDKRDSIKQELENWGIKTGIHYPQALPFMKPFQYQNHKHDDFPVAFSITKKILSLPMYPELTNHQIEYVCRKIKSII